MARKPRVEYAGAMYHLINRGDRREKIFLDDADRELFLKTLGEACAKTRWQVHAYCLMPNHFHLVVETPQANLVAGMKWFLGTYTARFNRRHKQFGHLFSGRYKSLVVDGDDGQYLRTVCDYVHLNPVRAKLVKPGKLLREYVWSSYGEYLKSPKKRVEWMRVDRLFGEMGIHKENALGRRRFEETMERRRGAELGEEWKGIRRGWCYGTDRFRREMMGRLSGKVGRHHYGAEVQETVEERAERIVEEEMNRIRWTEETLRNRKKSDPKKVRIAVRLRAETTMTLDWITNRLQMGTRTHLAHQLYWNRRRERKS